MTVSFTAPGSQSFLVPAGVTAISVEAFGARGGNNAEGNGGRLGAEARANAVAVTPGETLSVLVGGRGGDGTYGAEHPSFTYCAGGAGGWNGGGEGGGCTTIGIYQGGGGGGGGGASEVRRGTTALLVAGGGGGQGGELDGGPGGEAGEWGMGGSAGSGADGGQGGGGATGTVPGPGGAGQGGAAAGGGGSAGQGGAGATAFAAPGGGGGGGVFGGGGGGGSLNYSGGGGGGGSSMGPAGTTFVFGGDPANSGNGEVLISFAAATPILTTSASVDVAIGGQLHDTATLAGGFEPTGTITFRAYGPGDPSCASPPAFTDIESVGSGNGSYESAAFTPAQAGTYRWIASFSGDGGNEPVTGTCGDAGESATVAGLPTATTLEAVPNPSRLGEPVTFTATVSGTSPSGEVSFEDGGTAIGSATLGADGTATLTDAGLGAGSHAITAVYGGDAVDAESASAPLSVLVEEPAPAPSPAPTEARQPPSVTVTYSPNHAHAPNPGGGSRYTFHFRAGLPGATLYCSLDRAPFAPCASPRVYRHLKRGRHVFRVRAVDAAGQRSPIRTVRFTAGRRSGGGPT